MRLLLALLALWPAIAAAAPWNIVQNETRIEVDAGYLGGTVTMRFDRVDGAIDFDQNRVSRTTASISVPVSQVETGLGFVNALVRGKDYLNARDHPRITFDLKRLVRTSDSTADIFGDMTLLGVTRPIAFKAQVFRFGPLRNDPETFEAGFDLTGSVDRREFGNTTGLPQISAIFPIRIRLVIRSA